jgi:hypothetical protein
LRVSWRLRTASLHGYSVVEEICSVKDEKYLTAVFFGAASDGLFI